MSKKIDLTGQPFGRFIVIREYGRAKNGAVLWLCRCLGKHGDDFGLQRDFGVKTDSLTIASPLVYQTPMTGNLIVSVVGFLFLR